MTIATGANSDYEMFLRNLMAGIYEGGFESLIYDLGGLGYGIDFKVDFPKKAKWRGYKAKHPKKPWMIEDALGRIEDKRGLVYMDADTEIESRFDEIWGDMFDVGITIYPPGHREKKSIKTFRNITGYLNAGVIFLRKTEATSKFIEIWKDRIKDTKTGSDQEALTSIIKEATDMQEFQVYEWQGIKIKLFPCRTYNNTFGSYLKRRHAKIVHYAGDLQVDLALKRKEKYANNKV